MTITLGSRERHVSYVLGGFLFVVVELAEIVRGIKGPSLQMLGFLVPLRQAIEHTLELRKPYGRVQVRLVLLRIGEMALPRRRWVVHCCNQW